MKDLPLADRATISNMAPEYGATCGFFPVDEETLNYLCLTGRAKSRLNLLRNIVKKITYVLYIHKEGIQNIQILIEIDLSKLEPNLSGPKRPQDLIPFIPNEEGIQECN